MVGEDQNGVAEPEYFSDTDHYSNCQLTSAGWGDETGGS